MLQGTTGKHAQALRQHLGRLLDDPPICSDGLEASGIVASPFIESCLTQPGWEYDSKFERERAGHWLGQLAVVEGGGAAPVICLVEPGLLFAVFAPVRQSRRRLVEEGRIAAVIALPGGLLPGTGVGLAVLVLSPPSARTRIRMVDGTNEVVMKKADPEHRYRPPLLEVELLVDALVGTPHAWWAQDIPVAKVLEANSLMPRIFLETPVEQQTRSYYQKRGEQRFGDLFERVKAMPQAGGVADDRTIPVARLVGTDLPDFGIATVATGSMMIPVEVAERRPDIFLRPADLLISRPQQVSHRIAVVPASAPPPGEGGWLAGRNVRAFRPRSGALKDSQAMAMALASPLGRQALAELFDGRLLLSPGAMLELRLPTLSQEENFELGARFARHQDLENNLSAIREAQQALLQQLWPLPTN